MWVDGISVRLEQTKLCLLVMVGVLADGRKELNILAALPKSAHPAALAVLKDIYNAEDIDNA